MENQQSLQIRDRTEIPFLNKSIKKLFQSALVDTSSQNKSEATTHFSDVL